VHDTVERRWQHLNFFEHQCFLRARVPRIVTSGGKVRTVTPPWTRAGSGFTLLFEAFAMALIERETPVSRVAEMLGVNPQRVWTVFHHWVGLARENDDVSGVTRLGVDETSSRKGHKYVTVGVDLDERRVVHVSEGKGKGCIEALACFLEGRGVASDRIEALSMDLSPAFIAGAADVFPEAKITFDRFHVVKLLNKAMDAVRRVEQKEHVELKGSKYIFLKNRVNLSGKQETRLGDLIGCYPTLGEAYRLKVLFNDLWEIETEQEANIFLTFWCDQVEKANISAFITFANTIKTHWKGIVQFVNSRINNGVLEGINSKIQLAKRRARGYRNINNYINMIHFLCGKLTFSYPLYIT
jgi:transposase